MSNDNNQPTKGKGKRGKKVGTSDVVNMPIEKLVELLNPGTVVPVRRKWLEQYCAFNGVTFEEENAAPKVIGKLSDPADSVVRPRIELKEEEI